jgi:hypothetical protein
MRLRREARTGRTGIQTPGATATRLRHGKKCRPTLSQHNGGNRVNTIKKQLKQITKHPKIAIPAALLLILVVGVLAALVATGGQDKGTSATTNTGATGSTPRHGRGGKAAKKRKVKPAPVVRGTGTLDVARGVGRLALAQGRGLIKNPIGVRVRVSSAPKQIVTVDWLLACYKVSGTKVGHGRYRVRTPNVRSLPLPTSGAKQCTATVGAQLTRYGVGRVKVAVIAG